MDRSVTSCRDQPINAYYNNSTWTPDQSIVNADLLLPFLIYAIVGAIASVFNIICILVFVTKKEFREKYLSFAVLAFANLMSTIYICQAGFVRRNLIFSNQYSQLISSFECLRFVGPHLQIFGGQLPVVVLFVIDVERLIAVYIPMFYKVYITVRIRLFMVFGCFIVVAASQLFGYLASYLNRNACVNSFCSMSSACGLSYFNYNQAVVIICPVCALILNIFTYFGVKRVGEHSNIIKETRLVLITLIITFVDVILIACPNIIIFLQRNSFITISLADQCYLYICFCCNSAINLFVYIILRRDFRNHMLIMFSCGALRPYLYVTNANMMNNAGRVVPASGSIVHARGSIVPRSGTTIPIRTSLSIASSQGKRVDMR